MLLGKTGHSRCHLRAPLISSPRLFFTALTLLLPAACSHPSLFFFHLSGTNIEALLSCPPRSLSYPDSPSVPTRQGAFYPGPFPQKVSLGCTPCLRCSTRSEQSLDARRLTVPWGVCFGEEVLAGPALGGPPCFPKALLLTWLSHLCLRPLLVVFSLSVWINSFFPHGFVCVDCAPIHCLVHTIDGARTVLADASHFVKGS